MKSAPLFFVISLIALSFGACKSQSPCVISDFNDGWTFHLGDVADAQAISFDDSNWRKLALPHDWAIEGDFSANNPSGSNGGALPGGIGWYRKTFELDKNQKDKKVFIDFNGVYMNSDVWINGNLCPNAENLILFEIDGNGSIVGVDNGSPTSMERFKDNKRKAFYGKCLVVVQNNSKKERFN
ncbi:MAG: Glycosyl hydrolases family 2, sugar binding domain [Bacteroidetes bacterium ADurb.BinA174]|nr:MAG: Glycosyl hydrolases family 2, sugar binding domain [Bacteroidetes bacterium ADurb.BinA174]